MIVHERRRKGQGRKDGKRQEHHVRLQGREGKLDRVPRRKPALHLPLKYGQHLVEHAEERRCGKPCQSYYEAP